jgi:maltose alpha-D-glucosyltransferase / alpha-amylase
VSEASLWYRDSVFYQLRVASFYDSNGDGVGDLPGLIEKLDYLRDLGVDTLWLLPLYPSPMRDDGYDIADYVEVHADYGTLRDFRALLREAHGRGLRVVTELVLNHTSDQHAWFQRARRAPPGSRFRDFYVWSDTPERYPDARIIFKDFEHSNWTWDPVARAYYWHRFYSHQPDLNFDNPEVRRAMLRVVDFWLEMGVDGLRLDAVPYLYEREGTSCENLPETHQFLRELRAHVDANYSERMLLAEANQWPEDAAAYFGKADECHMAFHFPIMPRLYMALHMEDRHPILDILEQTPAIPESCQWAIFLRNHDELTLEMVTDEERDYMYRAYARDRRARINLGIRRRLAPLLANSRRKIELMNGLLLSLPGTPVVYYGDEIGMGDNVYLGDRNGVRTPMQWSPDRNAGFSRANPQQLFLPVVTDPEYNYEGLNVEIQERNPSSLLWWTKRILALRREFQAFGRGTLEPLPASNRRVLAYLRRHGSERILVVANLSRFSQFVELDLSEFRGSAPLELFGRVEFPRIGDLPYLLTLGPHGFHWFSIPEPEGAAGISGAGGELPEILCEHSWTGVFEEAARGALERRLPAYVRVQRWFRSKTRTIRSMRVADAIQVGPGDLRLLLVRTVYAEGEPEIYVLPVAFRLGAPPSERTLARLRIRIEGDAFEGVLDEAAGDPRLAGGLLDAVRRRRRLRGREVELHGVPSRALRSLLGEGAAPEARALGAEQTNTSWIFGGRLVGKLLRRVEEGPSPELEIMRHLSERARFSHVPVHAGHLELRGLGDEPATLMILQSCVAHAGDAWGLTLDHLTRYLEEMRTEAATPPEPAPRALVDRLGRIPTGEAAEPFGLYLDVVRLLGLRTAELHRALAASEDDPAFAPEVATPFARRSQYQSFRNLAVRSLEALASGRSALDAENGRLAERVLALEEPILERFRMLVDRPISGRLIRCHRDYHLGQVLYTGKDFVIIDFEGEPARSLSERRRKRSPLVDVAGMLRSFHYAVESALAGRVERSAIRAEDRSHLEPWGRHWFAWVSAAFFETYLDAMRGSALVPESREEVGLLLDVYLTEKALYELGYELDHRPLWVGIPLRGILEVLGGAEGGA